MKKARCIFITHSLPKAITEWIGGQHKDLGEGGSKQTFVGAAAGVGGSLQSAAQNQSLRDSNFGNPNKKADATEDTPDTKKQKQADASETEVAPKGGTETPAGGTETTKPRRQ